MHEVVIIDAVRTAVGRHGGTLSAVRPDDLCAIPIKAIVERTGIDPAIVEEVYMGCANQAGEQMRYGLATLCVGVGQGEATVIEML
jgi:acetyl-CoA acetyltransferase